MEYLQFITGLVVLLVSGNFLVKGGISIARHFNISTLVVGIVVVSLGTSAPELFVSIQGALSGHDEFSIGTVVGSNISNIGLVLGLTAIVFPILINKNSIRIDWPIMMLSSILFYIFILNGKLESWEGAVFLVLLVLYIVFLLRKSRKEIPGHKAKTQVPEYSLLISLVLIIISSFGLAFGANWLVKGGSVIAINFGVSESAISLTVFAFGTSLPELATSLIAAFKKETDISVGNIIGSNIFNLFGILGITSIIKTIPVNERITSIDIWWMLGIAVLLFLLMFPLKRSSLNKYKGFGLAIVYFSYLFFVFSS